MLGGALGIAVMSALQTNGARWDFVFAVFAATAVVVAGFGSRALRRGGGARRPGDRRLD